MTLMQFPNNCSLTQIFIRHQKRSSPWLRYKFVGIPIEYFLKSTLRILENIQLMWLICQKKSYLICDKITNFRIFMQPIPNFF